MAVMQLEKLPESNRCLLPGLWLNYPITCVADVPDTGVTSGPKARTQYGTKLIFLL